MKLRSKKNSYNWEKVTHAGDEGRGKNNDRRKGKQKVGFHLVVFDTSKTQNFGHVSWRSRRIVSHVNASPFCAIQLDESTDIAHLPQLSVFIRYICNGEVSEELLFCKTLKLHTRGEDVFQVIDEFIKDNDISWKKCAGICTDGAAACTGINSGVVKRIKDKAPNAKWTHCFLHRQALCNYPRNCMTH